ncbi:hypothetical protein T11_14974 [Trichinella zimbabwensis]|uniref:Uncharacterized protein n=1 Tax=Trichinella zimbabwensis TaxID=268475 RepID=A0A0V1H3I8_9BILA|nr:hypothetical protein T11_14974 [Trichinella zimbabwensis]
MVTSNSDTPKEKRRCSVMCRLSNAEQIHRASCLPDIDSFSSGASPQSNGFTEAAVELTKKRIAVSWTSESFDEDKFSTSILLYKNVPCQEGASPAMLALNRPIEDCLPMHDTTFAVEWRWEVSAQEQQKEGEKERQVYYYNLHTQELTPLKISAQVLVQHRITKKWSTRVS